MLQRISGKSVRPLELSVQKVYGWVYIIPINSDSGTRNPEPDFLGALYRGSLNNRNRTENLSFPGCHIRASTWYEDFERGLDKRNTVPHKMLYDN